MKKYMETEVTPPSLGDKIRSEIDRIETDIQKKEAELAVLRDSLKKCKKALKALE